MKKIVVLFVGLGIFSISQAAQICWVERVAKHDGELRVYMSDRNIGAVRKIVHLDGTETSVERNSSGFITLKEGETAYMSVPHDSCTAKAISVEGVLGVQLAATNCMHGMACQKATEFVPAE